MPNEAMQKITETQALEYLKRYFGDGTGQGGFLGLNFETFGGGGSGDPFAITAEDLLAVSMLSVHVPAKAALGILGEDAARISELLRRLDPDLKFEELGQDGFDDLLGPQGPAQELWDLLRRNGSERWGIGATTASKIMARKRPHLIPIYDSVVAKASRLTSSKDHWTVWYQALAPLALPSASGSAEKTLTQRLGDLREKSGLADKSLLRILDVVIWMHDPKSGSRRSSNNRS
ncbi:hypothetical protein GCM10009715_05890 [Paeniglutamicibacter psychrophenolicus]|uniref:HhH-GPD domain-containing protein n=1 Tax=Paeniglutamicibacter psychrophenolicus TaxID=257454 RepID=A0ABS4WDU2_9MICC|nr:DUF6308 family protein [Paeniglutamicibacter psychrophenolicus]MBP2374385.1 hypothetical protein [Paeniglutamicibacter psychrophenolicus]